jgi:hypothetical protein
VLLVVVSPVVLFECMMMHGLTNPKSPVVFVQRDYIGSCLNLVCAVLHLVLSEKSCCVCAERIYRILSEFSLCCSSFGAVGEVLLCLC